MIGSSIPRSCCSVIARAPFVLRSPHNLVDTWLDRLACTLSTLAMRVHVSAQQRVHAGLIAAPLATKPLDNVGVDAKRKQCFRCRSIEAALYHRPREHFGRPGRRVVINNNL